MIPQLAFSFPLGKEKLDRGRSGADSGFCRAPIDWISKTRLRILLMERCWKFSLLCYKKRYGGDIVLAMARFAMCGES